MDPGDVVYMLWFEWGLRSQLAQKQAWEYWVFLSEAGPKRWGKMILQMAIGIDQMFSSGTAFGHNYQKEWPAPEKPDLLSKDLGP